MKLLRKNMNLPSIHWIRGVIVPMVFIFLSMEVFSQTMVKGIVSNGSNNETLIGATVRLKGTTKGSVTDVNGNYAIEVPDNQSILQFSFIGFLKKEVQVGNQSIIDVKLIEDIANLNEVVVIGYGKVKKSDLSGSVASVSQEDIQGVVAPSTAEVLRGRASGVLVSSSSGKPGSQPNILIRGQNSINSGSSPLIVVDGIPGVDINTVNPNDIQSMEILKDAASTAIYGSTGANGVILISTKKGTKGKPTFTFDSKVGIKYFNNFE